jgi:hypothetical protein
MRHPYIALRIVLTAAAILHLAIGLVGVTPSSPLSIALVLYGGALQFSPQIAYLVQIFGAYMLTIGALCVYSIWDPVKNKSIIHGMIFLLLFRGVQRILTIGQAETAYGLVPDFYWIQTALFLIVGLALLWLRPRRNEQTAS